MFIYIKLIVSAMLWITSIWMVSKYIIDFRSDYKLSNLERKLLPLWLFTMVSMGCILIHSIDHIGELN